MKKMDGRALVSGDTQTIHDFIRNADFVEGPDDLWPLVAFDGEAMCFTGAAHDFDKICNRTHDHEAKLCAFDLLELTGTNFSTRVCFLGTRHASVERLQQCNLNRLGRDQTVLRGARHKCGPVFLIGHHVNHGHDF